MQEPGLEVRCNIVRELSTGELLCHPLLVQQRYFGVSLGGSMGDKAVPKNGNCIQMMARESYW